MFAVVNYCFEDSRLTVVYLILKALGKEGKILEVDSDGDVVVVVGTDLWLFNPAALEDLTGGEATARRGEVATGSPG